MVVSLDAGRCISTDKLKYYISMRPDTIHGPDHCYTRTVSEILPEWQTQANSDELSSE